MSVERYIRFKVEVPRDLDYDDAEVYRKLEYMGPVREDGRIEKKFLRKSIKQPWQRYVDTNEYLQNRDDHPEELSADIDAVQILEDMDKLSFIKKYLAKLMF